MQKQGQLLPKDAKNAAMKRLISGRFKQERLTNPKLNSSSAPNVNTPGEATGNHKA